MPPALDPEIRAILTWLTAEGKELPMGPMRWRDGEGKRTAIAVGKIGGKERKEPVLTIDTS